MKANSWIINGVMALAIIVLYVLHFNSNSMPIKSSAMAAGGVKVAYFEIDSIQNSYNFFKDVKAALQAKDVENAKQTIQLWLQPSLRLQSKNSVSSSFNLN